MITEARGRIDIHKIVLDEPIQDFRFRPEVEVTDEKWANLIQELNLAELEPVDESDLDGYYGLAAQMKIIDSERFSDVKLREPKWADLGATLKDNEDTFGFISYIEYCSALRILFGKKFRFRDDKLKYNILRARLSRSNAELSQELSAYKILQPGDHAVDRMFSRRIFDTIKETDYEDKKVYFRAFVLIAFPQFASEVKLEKADWDMARKRLGIGTIFNFDYALIARNMALASADSITIDGDGLHLNFEELKLNTDALKMPETKRYGS